MTRLSELNRAEIFALMPRHFWSQRVLRLMAESSCR